MLTRLSARFGCPPKHQLGLALRHAGSVFLSFQGNTAGKHYYLTVLETLHPGAVELLSHSSTSSVFLSQVCTIVIDPCILLYFRIFVFQPERVNSINLSFVYFFTPSSISCRILVTELRTEGIFSIMDCSAMDPRGRVAVASTGLNFVGGVNNKHEDKLAMYFQKTPPPCGKVSSSQMKAIDKEQSGAVGIAAGIPTTKRLKVRSSTDSTFLFTAHHGSS